MKYVKITLILVLLFSIIPFASAISYLETYDSQRVSLMHMNGTNDGTIFTDENGISLFRNGVVTKTGTKYLGSASAYFDGTQDYINLNSSSSSAWTWGTGDFTLLFWMYRGDTTGNMMSFYRNAADRTQLFDIDGDGTSLAWYDGTMRKADYGSSMVGAWHQVVIQRKTFPDSSKNLIIYIDGSSKYNASISVDFQGGGPFVIGAYDAAAPASNNYNGYYDEFAIWKGVAIPIAELYPQTLEVAEITADTTPPDSITGLTNTTALCTEITWQWTNPAGSFNADYAYLYTLKNDVWIGNYSNSTSAATWTGLTALTNYTFSSKTVDLKGNMNATWVNRTVLTPVCLTPTPTPVPTAVPGAQWCGLQSIYFNHGYAVLPAGYELLNITPPGPPEIDENVTVKVSTSPKLIDSYISPQGYPGVTAIAAGTRTYNMYGYVGGAAGITRFNVTLHTRDITGLETFHYQAYSDDINDLSVANQQFSFSHPQINMAVTDRLVIRVYADTDSASDKEVHWIYQGTTHSSRVDSAYFNCIPATTPTITPTWQPEINPPTDYKADPWTMVKDWWWLPVTIAAFMIIFGGKR